MGGQPQTGGVSVPGSAEGTEKGTNTGFMGEDKGKDKATAVQNHQDAGEGLRGQQHPHNRGHTETGASGRQPLLGNNNRPLAGPNTTATTTHHAGATREGSGASERQPLLGNNNRPQAGASTSTTHGTVTMAAHIPDLTEPLPDVPLPHFAYMYDVYTSMHHGHSVTCSLMSE